MQLSIKKNSSPIIIGLSGGVDSAVAAYLLKDAGHPIEAVFMKNWQSDDDTYCSASDDMADAAAVCDLLHIDLQVVNFADQYWERVFSYFLAAYRAGYTPNPDILCNKEIKFSAFLNYAKQRGASAIATGHYARIHEHGQTRHLLKAADLEKDQSYFLYALNQYQLSHSLFPLGEMQKKAVRQLAKKIGLPNHAKKDSTGICFIGERKFKKFLNDYLPSKKGDIETIDGECLGEHDGLMFYTIGQRQGLQIGGKKGKNQAAWYIAKKELQRNVLVVVQGDHPALYQPGLIVTELHWIAEPPAFPAKLQAKTRYRQADQACMLAPFDNEQFQVTFEIPQRAITPGQSIVFYQDDICLGGGIIKS